MTWHFMKSETILVCNLIFCSCSEACNPSSLLNEGENLCLDDDESEVIKILSRIAINPAFYEGVAITIAQL